MEKAERKKRIILAVYGVLFLLIIIGLYSMFRPAPTCFDGKKNQNEEGVDCGGVCQKKCPTQITAQDLIIEKTGVVPSGLNGKYDFYAYIINPNAIYGSKKFTYDLKIRDASGQVLAEKESSSFILPGERKYVIQNNLDVSGDPVSAEMNILDSDWIEFNEYYEKPDLKITNKVYNEISNGTGFAEAKGLLKNSSPFDFDTINIQVILKDDSGKVTALNFTQMKTVNSQSQRDFRVLWPNSFPGKVSSMEAQAEVNVFDSDTFFKKFYQSEKFQEY